MQLAYFRKRLQAKLLKYGSLYKLIKKVGIITIVGFIITVSIDIMSKRFYKLRGTNYGLLEALFYPKSIDKWSRYSYVVNEIKKLRVKNKILEVGSGGAGIAHFSGREHEVFLIDVRKDVFQKLKFPHRVVADGCKLPFRDKIFDVVISVDTVEHIPKSIRHNFYNELKRVCRRKIILTCPMQSNDGIFQGKDYDIIFQYLHERKYGVREPNTDQHIAAGHPTLEEIKYEFPNSTIQGYKNCNVWLKYMLFSRKPILGLFCGLLYYLLWKKDDNKPPYWGAIIISDC